MKCFYDPSQDAVGTCKSCGRGLSRDHLTDLDKGLACKNRCETDVKALIALINRNIASSAAANQILKRSSNAGYGTGFFLTVMGAMFTFMGLREPRLGFTLYLGFVFLAYGLWTFIRTARHAAIVSKLPDEPQNQEAAAENQLGQMP